MARNFPNKNWFHKTYKSLGLSMLFLLFISLHGSHFCEIINAKSRNNPLWHPIPLPLPDINIQIVAKRMISSIIHTLAWKHFFSALGCQMYRIKISKYEKYLWKCKKTVVGCCGGMMPKSKKIGSAEKLWIFFIHCSFDGASDFPRFTCILHLVFAFLTCLIPNSWYEFVCWKKLFCSFSPDCLFLQTLKFSLIIRVYYINLYREKNIS